MDMNNTRTLTSWRLLYVTYVLIPIAAGLDKYFNYLTEWVSYLHQDIPQLLNLTSLQCMYIVGIIEVVAGILVFLKPRIGGLVVCTWLLIISLQLIITGIYSSSARAQIMPPYDIAVRDIAMAVGAYALVLLSKDLNK